MEDVAEGNHEGPEDCRRLART